MLFIFSNISFSVKLLKTPPHALFWSNKFLHYWHGRRTVPVLLLSLKGDPAKHIALVVSFLQLSVSGNPNAVESIGPNA
jgi:hypothetical protein